MEVHHPDIEHLIGGEPSLCGRRGLGIEEGEIACCADAEALGGGKATHGGVSVIKLPSVEAL